MIPSKQTLGNNEKRGSYRSEVAAHEPRNIACLVTYQVVARIGWIFKTETVVMPAVLDACIASGMLRGFLPVLNRIGTSLFPLVVAPLVSRTKSIRWLLVGTTIGLSICFAVLSVAWSCLLNDHPFFLAIIFLGTYGLFSAINGCNQLLVATLQGRLISAGRRGRVLVVSVTSGSVFAIIAAFVALGPWLQEPDGFVKIFAATSFFFFAAAVVPLFFKESENLFSAESRRASEAVRPHSFWQVLSHDSSLARLAVVAASFSAAMILFPHYQAFAREQFGNTSHSLLTWIVVQNIATGLASLVVGPLADHRGNRLVIIWLLGCCTGTPLFVAALTMASQSTAMQWFWLAYMPLGFNPIMLRIISNYALELAPSVGLQPRYVSIVGGVMAIPFVLSPIVGWGIDILGGIPFFLAGAAIIALGTLVAFGLPEPRNRHFNMQKS
mgnify:FL=1